MHHTEITQKLEYGFILSIICSLASGKIMQEIIDSAAYVPPPPSEETVKRINKL